MSRKRVMIVEDQREIARMIHSAIQLMDASLDIVDALSAEEASLELSERGADLIVLDVRLPKSAAWSCWNAGAFRTSTSP